MEHVIAEYRRQQAAFTVAATERLSARGLPTYQGMDAATIAARVMQPGYQAFGQEFAEGIDGALEAYFGRIGTLRAQQQGRIDDVLEALRIAAAVMNDHFAGVLQADAAALAWWYERMFAIIYRAAAMAARSYTIAREHMALSAARQIQNAEQPILPVGGGVLLVYLQAPCNQDRALLLLESLILKTHEHQARAVIFDCEALVAPEASGIAVMARCFETLIVQGVSVLLARLGEGAALSFLAQGIDMLPIESMASLSDAMERARAVSCSARLER